jgi:hypothetical protein
MPANGNRVTQKQLYQEVMALEGRLSSKIDAVLAAVNENRTLSAAEFACVNEGMRNLKGDLKGPGGLVERVDRIEASETRWKAFSAVLGSLGGALAGFLTGRQG